MTIDPTPPVAAGASIAASTSIGAVSLQVSDLERARAFYEQVLGLVPTFTAGEGGRVGLTASGGGRELVGLHEDREAPPFDPHGNGLFHLALLVPSRPELARSLRRIARAGWPLTGASDHLVSEALYLRDPDGNGIEIYRDRARTQWPHDDRGAPQMATLRLDLSDLLSEPDDDAGANAGSPIAAGTRMGHVHLQVADLDAAERFYGGALGFDVTARAYPGALFVSAGGYHHHIGLNTWHSQGAPPIAAGAVGLRSFELLAPGRAARQQVLARLAAAGVDVGAADRGSVDPGSPAPVLVHDPFGIAIVLRCT